MAIVKIKSSEFIKNVLTLMSGTVLSQFLLIAFSPVLSRLYNPEAFGQFAFYFSIVNILIVLSTLRYENAIVTAHSYKESRNVLVLTLSVSFFFFIISQIIVLLFHNKLLLLFPELIFDKFNFVVNAIPFSVLIYSIYQTISFFSIRKKNYKSIANGRILQSSSQISLNVILCKTGVWGFVIGSFIGMLLFVRRNIKFQFLYIYLKRSSFAFIKKTALKYIYYPKFDVISSLLGVLSLQIPIIFLSFCFDSKVVGYFSMSQRILSLPITFVGQAIGQVFYQKACENENAGVSLLKLYIITLKNLFLVGSLPSIIIFVFGPTLFGFILGDEWTQAGIYSKWMIPWIFTMLVVSPVSNIINIKKLLKTNMYYSILFLLSRVLSLYIGVYYSNPLLSIQLYSFVGVLFNVGYLIWFYKVVK